MKPELKVVRSTEDELRALLGERATLRGTLRAVDQLIAEHGRRLAKERGVAFIRFEHLQREFGQ